MKKNFLFLGFLVSREEMEEILREDKFPAIQTYKFILNLIRGIENQNKVECTYISAKPISDYPFFRKRVIKLKKVKEVIEGNEINLISIPFINTPLLKILSRTISAIFFSLKEYMKVKNKGGIIVYSVHVPFMLVGFILSKIYKIPYIGIWTDPPSINIGRESYIKRNLRKIELEISKRLMKNVDKTIVLTRYLAQDFAPKKEYLIVEGITEYCENDEGLNCKENNFFKIVYTGSLEKRYGIKNIVEGFKLINNEKIILEIYGRGNYEEELKKECLMNSKIKYKGFLKNEEILKIQQKANFLINARNSNDEYVKYSFPSKMLEYMMSGTPLISTLLPGIPEEYRNYIIILENNSPEVIAQKINEITSWPTNKILKIGKEAKDYAITKNYKIQGKRIVDFI